MDSLWQRRGVFLALVALAALYLFPFYWLAQSSLKSPTALKAVPPTFLPSEGERAQTTLPKIVRTDADGSWLRLVDAADPERGATSTWWLQLGADGAPGERVVWAPVAASPPAEGVVAVQQRRVIEIAGAAGEWLDLATVVRSRDGQAHRWVVAQPRSGGEVQVFQDPAIAAVQRLAPRWANYREALAGPEAAAAGAAAASSVGFARFLGNSLFVSLAAVIGQCLTASMAAFAFARLRFPGRDLLFVILLATLMVPAQVTMIPLFGVYKSLGWIDTFLPLIVPQFTAGAFNVFLLRQYMLTLPKELDESAAVDGCGAIRTWWSVILPNTAPAMIVVALFTFVWTWQDVMGPLIYLDDPALRTVPLGLEFFRSPYVDNSHLLLAGAVLSMLPVALLFLVLQRRIMGGIATTGLKG